MAPEDEATPVDVPAPPSNVYAGSPVDDGNRKRKASADEGSMKRARQRSNDDGSRPPPKRWASPDRKLAGHNIEQERRESVVTQEERKRGKRLFGGLLSTLSQPSTTSSQQRRRLEIERRQKEKMQQQTAEDDRQRSDKRAALEKMRMEQQVAWEEQVMRNKHAKELKLAQFLRTRSKPELYYLPWRPTPREADTIDDQIRETKASIARELEDFKSRREGYLGRFGPRRDSDACRTEQPPVPAPKPEASPPRPAANFAGAEQQPKSAHDDDLHDDSGDILVEAEEDMVIY
ncbi:Uncharacterized protein TCAP_02158 [Tolypocladium capitatum]|uniref:Pinin/SDK/MemA protein domain-containing protein n=1 Tax=Tolypocladium capitatum TaxID=45235 RepID=A0A2K3QK31_9HYPO|nr:Uncharacterized protein TCAP_02158 [Tolypocladium capitatum]